MVRDDDDPVTRRELMAAAGSGVGAYILTAALSEGDVGGAGGGPILAAGAGGGTSLDASGRFVVASDTSEVDSVARNLPAIGILTDGNIYVVEQEREANGTETIQMGEEVGEIIIADDKQSGKSEINHYPAVVLSRDGNSYLIEE